MTDEEHPDCTTARECELYDALMGLASHAMANYPNYRKWSQGGLVLAPVVAHALRLTGSELSPQEPGTTALRADIADALDWLESSATIKNNAFNVPEIDHHNKMAHAQAERIRLAIFSRPALPRAEQGAGS